MLDWKSNQDNGTNDWVPSSSLSSELVGHEMGDQFGTSLSFHPNGTRLVVGSPFANHNHDDDTSSKSNVGRVQVFDWNKHNSSEDETTTSSSSWSLTWERYGANKFDNMGYSVALAADGSHLAVSARYHDDTTTPNIGQVQVFQWKEESNNNSTWIPVGDANTSSLLQGIDESDRLGESLAFSQNASRLVIGTLYSNGINGTENNVGHVTILDFIPSESSKNNNNNNTWTPMSETKLYGREAGHRFGYSVVLSGDGTRLAARSIYFNVTQDTWVSSVTIYDYDRARREWIPFESDWEPAGGRPVLGDAFGYSMAMSKDGSRLVVAGHEQLYIWEAESSSSSSIPKWKTMECADEPKDESTTTFGYSVALSDDGTILAVGKRHKDAPTDYHVQMYEAC